jgi:hypothetical protein
VSDEGQKVYGVVLAVVSGRAEAKDGQRVQVKFRSLPEGARPSEASSLCRMATGHLPEVNDEVLVAFENGDIERPFIVGTLSNGGEAHLLSKSTIQGGAYWKGSTVGAGPIGGNLEKSPDELRVVASHKLHALILNDRKDAPRVALQSSQKHRIVLDDTGDQPSQIEIFDGKEENYILIDTKNKRIIIESKSGDMMLKAKNLLHIEARVIEITADNVNTKAGDVFTKAAGDISFYAGRYLHLEGGSMVTVTSFSSVAVSSSSNMTVSSSGTMIIKGSTVNIN